MFREKSLKADTNISVLIQQSLRARWPGNADDTEVTTHVLTDGCPVFGPSLLMPVSARRLTLPRLVPTSCNADPARGADSRRVAATDNPGRMRAKSMIVTRRSNGCAGASE